jgi:hypothetical protein
MRWQVTASARAYVCIQRPVPRDQPRPRARVPLGFLEFKSFLPFEIRSSDDAEDDAGAGIVVAGMTTGGVGTTMTGTGWSLDRTNLTQMTPNPVRRL